MGAGGQGGGSFFPQDTLSQCLSGLAVAHVGVHHLGCKTLAHDHLGGMFIPAPPLVVSFFSACACPPQLNPPPSQDLLREAIMHVQQHLQLQACSKHFSERCHKSPTRKLLLMTHRTDALHDGTDTLEGSTNKLLLLVKWICETFRCAMYCLFIYIIISRT